MAKLLEISMLALICKISRGKKNKSIFVNKSENVGLLNIL